MSGDRGVAWVGGEGIVVHDAADGVLQITEYRLTVKFPTY
jgi:hypothetical protein